MDNSIEKLEKIIIEYYPSGKLKKQIYYYNNPDDNTIVNYSVTNDTPAIIEYYESGQIKAYHYLYYCQFSSSRYHRTDGKAAFIEYYENGNLKSNSYYYYGSNRQCSPAKEYFDEDGNLILTVQYINCLIKSYCCHNKKGKELKKKLYGKRRSIIDFFKEFNMRSANRISME
jgi:antitoxin component YwqK of YwqJK toxin-antitoxin module